MTAHMVPVRVSNEDGGEWRQPCRICSHRFVVRLREIRSRSSIDSDELTPILGDHKVVIREFETGQCVDATGNNLGNAPRRERVARSGFLGKRRCQYDWVVKICVATAA